MSRPTRDELAEIILQRLTEQSSHDYTWPRWAAAREAANALVEAGLLAPDTAEAADELRARIEALHNRCDGTCGSQRYGTCHHCADEWPCPTIDALAAPPGEAVPCPVCGRSIGTTRWGRIANHGSPPCSSSQRLPTSAAPPDPTAVADRHDCPWDGREETRTDCACPGSAASPDPAAGEA